MGLVTVTATDTFSSGDVVVAGRPGLFQTAPIFPLGLVSISDLLAWANSFPSDITPTLASGSGATDLTISVASGTGSQFPGDSFEVSIDDEIIFISTRSGDTLNVGLRGAENSTPAVHSSGSNVQLLVTALSHNQVAAELVEIEQLIGPKGQHVFPAEIALAPGAGGNFTVAHGLGVIPRYVLLQLTSGGAIWFQSPTRYDATNLYLVASDAGVTGFAEVWP